MRSSENGPTWAKEPGLAANLCRAITIPAEPGEIESYHVLGGQVHFLSQAFLQLMKNISSWSHWSRTLWTSESCFSRNV